MSTPSTITTTPNRYKLLFTVPASSLEDCKSALFAAGAGTYPGGKYSQVSFETKGTGQFMANEGATPNKGEVGKLERLEEVKVEVLCVGEEVMRRSVGELKR